MESNLKTLEQLESDARAMLVQLGSDKFGHKNWCCIVAALDNIGDTTYAFQAFEQDGLGATKSDQYLRLFGLLQSIFIQQDSIQLLFDKIVVTRDASKSESNSERLRWLRNKLVGHPADNAGRICRMMLSNSEFMVEYWDKKTMSTSTENLKLADLYSGYIQEAVNKLQQLKNQIKGQ